MRKLISTFIVFIISFFILWWFINTYAIVENNDSKIVNLYFFWWNRCPHCEKEKVFLEKIKDKYPWLKINDFEVWWSKENINLMVSFWEKLNANISGVPFTVIGDKYIIGWMDEKNTWTKIEDMIKCAFNESCRDIWKELNISNNQEIVSNDLNNSNDNNYFETLTLPIIWEINIKNLSLPLLTIIIWWIDWFNPCAMWALIFLISLLLWMKNRKKMWIFGITFIITSAFVYFLFLAAWLKLLLFIGFISWIRIAIACVAMIGWWYYLKEYFLNPYWICPTEKSDKRKKFFEKLKTIIHEKHFFIAFFWIILLASAVNLIELICSAGLPVVYTQILASNNLSILQYYLYLILYIFVFMLDDIFVFIIAMLTLRITWISSKYSHFSHLFWGIIMIIIWILLIFKPEWLMFG